MQILRLTVRHDCPFSNPVARTGSSHVTHLCHRGREAMLEVRTPRPDDLQELLTTYQGLGGTVLLRSEDGESALVRFPLCECCRRGKVIPTLEEGGLHYLPPSVYVSSGEEIYQFLSPSGSIDLGSLTGPEGKVEVVRTAVRPLTDLEFTEGFLVPTGVLFQDLTPRQRFALLTAIQRGYYRIPRPVSTEELGHALGISREAFEALLRKGENKILASLFPYLVLGSGAADSGEAPDPPPP
jgi:predicted DNA binding protein